MLNKKTVLTIGALSTIVAATLIYLKNRKNKKCEQDYFLEEDEENNLEEFLEYE